LSFDGTCRITSQIFFTIVNNESRTNIGNELMIDVIETDYGFAMCTIHTVHRVGHARALITLDDIDMVAAEIGMLFPCGPETHLPFVHSCRRRQFSRLQSRRVLVKLMC
jgi:hypothetical protein